MGFYEITGLKAEDLQPDHRELVAEHIGADPHNRKLRASYELLNILAFNGGYRGGPRQRLVRATNRLLRQLATAGDGDLQCQLGQYLMDRKVTAAPGMTNAEEAKYWLEQALAQGRGRAAFLLGVLYEYPRSGVPRDIDRSEYYHGLAVALGYDARTA